MLLSRASGQSVHSSLESADGIGAGHRSSRGSAWITIDPNRGLPVGSDRAPANRSADHRIFALVPHHSRQSLDRVPTLRTSCEVPGVLVIDSRVLASRTTSISLANSCEKPGALTTTALRHESRKGSMRAEMAEGDFMESLPRGPLRPRPGASGGRPTSCEGRLGPDASWWGPIVVLPTRAAWLPKLRVVG